MEEEHSVEFINLFNTNDTGNQIFSSGSLIEEKSNNTFGFEKIYEYPFSGKLVRKKAGEFLCLDGVFFDAIVGVSDVDLRLYS